MTSNSNPKVLFYDIETSQNLVALFSLANNDWVDPANIIQERFIISAAYKWQGESKIHSVSVLDNPKLFKEDHTNDLHVVKTIHGLLSQADVVVGHNSDKFDNKWVATRAMFHGLDPIPPFISVDTYKVAKANFYFNSNKLAYLGEFLGLGAKVPTKGGLWLKVLQGDEEAIRDMVKYNKGAIVLLEKVFNKLTPWMPNHFSRELFGKVGCPRCGSHKVQSRGVHRAITRTYQRYVCNSCRGWFRELRAQEGSTTKMRVI